MINSFPVLSIYLKKILPLMILGKIDTVVFCHFFPRFVHYVQETQLIVTQVLKPTFPASADCSILTLSAMSPNFFS